jgi:hypothetical protein
LGLKALSLPVGFSSLLVIRDFSPSHALVFPHSFNPYYHSLSLISCCIIILIFKMLKSTVLSIVSFLMLVDPSVAVGCATHVIGHCEDQITHLYDPDTGEICDLLDCGGGRAPPKTTVPGCPLYNGPGPNVAATSYLSCFAELAAATEKPNPGVVPDTTTSVTTTSTIQVTVTGIPTFTTATPVDSAISSTSASTTMTMDPRIGSNETLTTSFTSTSSSTSSSSSKSSSAPAKQSNHAMKPLEGSFMGIAGAFIGAVALL